MSAEIVNPYVWFDDQLQGLGDRFLVELEQLDARLAKTAFCTKSWNQPRFAEA